MKNLFFFKNIITQKKKGGAMIVLMLVFFVIFILAFGSGYLVFLNTSKSVDVSNGIKARYAALAGKDRALYEAIKNNYDFVGVCSDNEFYEVFYEEIGDGSSYSINCVNNAGDKTFYSVGKYKNVEISLEIDCINIEKDCSASCKTGSICGGGKLLKTDTYALSISPSGCDASGANCDNKFLTADTVNFQWDTTPPPPPFVCGSTLIDPRDSNQYPTVLIGSQCWMAKNLAYLPSIQDASTFVTYGKKSQPAYGVYDYTGTDVAAAKATANYQTYGVLYNWYAAVATSSTTGTEGTQGVCPVGWHLPNSAEFTTLSTTLGDDGGKLKQSGTTTWRSPNTGATNSSGFTALPAGYRYSSGAFGDMGYITFFWSSSFSSSGALLRYLYYGYASFSFYSDSPVFGFSVRCIKDSSGSGSITYKGASSSDNGKINNTTLAPQTNTYLEAVKYCDDLVANGYSDWYLPATNELAALRSDSAFSYFNLQSVSGDDYWVSTEQGSTTPTMAGYIKMSTGASSNADKGSEFKVRCVRKNIVRKNIFNPCSGETVCGSKCSYGDKEYNTVQIGTQCWFKENLNYDNGCSSKTWTNSTDTGWCGCYTPSDSTCANYGRLYQWSAAMNATTTEGAQGVCPSGWHVPSRANFTTLKAYLNSSATYKCSGTTDYIGKSLAATSTWTTYSTSCAVGNTIATNNASGFNLFSSGYKNPTAAFTTAGYSATMWSSTQSGASAYDLGLYYTNQTFNETLDSKPYAFSVRCIKN